MKSHNEEDIFEVIHTSKGKARNKVSNVVIETATKGLLYRTNVYLDGFLVDAKEMSCLDIATLENGGSVFKERYLSTHTAFEIQYFIEMLGNDAQLLTDGEEIKSFELFNKLTSKKFIIGEEEGMESELKYLSIIKNIRDHDKKLFEKIKKLPQKARTARAIETNIEGTEDFVLTYFRKGKLEKFFMASKEDATEIDFITAAKLFEAGVKTKRYNIGSNFHDLLQKNKDFLQETLIEERGDHILPGSHKGRDNPTRILKILKSRELKNWPSFTKTETSYISQVIELLQEGCLPKTTIKKLWTAIKDLQLPPDILEALKKNIPGEFFNTPATNPDNILNHPNKVILSECFIKTGAKK